MAPPIPGLRRRAAPRRSTGDVLAGAAAVVALAVLTVGIPAALVTIFGLPVPHHLSLSVLTQQLGLTAILRVLTVVVWLAWLQLVWCVVAEVRAAVRNAGMASRVPLAGGTQAVIHRLVTTALLLLTATVAITPALAHSGPSLAPPAAVSVTHQARAQQQAEAAPSQTAGAGQHRLEKIYVVTPPVGRYHESLWEIAHNHLGNGRRYGEIFELNKDHVQPDGSKLTIASLIRPGWVLRMPQDAHGPGIRSVTPEAARAVRHGGDPAELSQAHGGRGELASAPAASLAQAGAEHRSGEHGSGDHGSGQHGSSDHGPGEQLATAGGQHHRDPGALAGPAAASQPAGHGLVDYPADLAAATLLAAGLLTALGRRRREQLWHRAFGRRVAGPAADAAVAETAIRLGASEESARLLDAGLRQLGAALADQGRRPPGGYAARLTDEHLDLFIAPPEQNPAPPWLAVDGGHIWRLPLAAAAGLDLAGSSSGGAPFPGLVSLGTDADGRVLVDLESAHGLIAVSGPAEPVRAVLAAMAMELATNRWSDQMEITLVGFGAELVTIAPDRVRAVDSLAEVLPGLEARAAECAEAVARTGSDWVLTGRTAGSNSGPWVPHYLITAEPPAPGERERLLALARSRYRTAAGYLIAGDVPGAAWSWTVTDEGRLDAGPLGFDVAAQLLPPRQYAAVAELFAAAADPGGTILGLPPLDAAPAAQLVPGARMPVEIRLLGPVSVRAPGAIEVARAALATEIVVYLAVHPGGVHRSVLTGAIWPRGVTVEVRDAAFARVQDWLGYDAAGQPHLAADADGRLRLGPQVRVDWQVFRALAARAGQSSRASSAERDYLERALREITGALLDDRDQRRYAWLATDGWEFEVTALVADVAHRLSGLRRTGDPAAAMAAARTGLRLAVDDEMLWRDLLLAADATDDRATLPGVVAEITTRAALDQVLPRMAPETEALIDELMPSWRTSVA
jgi:hypothetical protein